MAEYEGSMVCPVRVEGIHEQVSRFDRLGDVISRLEGPYANLNLVRSSIHGCLGWPYSEAGEQLHMVASESGIWAALSDRQTSITDSVMADSGGPTSSEKVADIIPIDHKGKALYLVVKGMRQSAQQRDADRLIRLNYSFGWLVNYAPSRDLLGSRISKTADGGDAAKGFEWINPSYTPPCSLYSLHEWVRIAWGNPEKPTLPAEDVDAVYQRFASENGGVYSRQEEFQGLPSEISRHRSEVNKEKLTLILAVMEKHIGRRTGDLEAF